MEAEQARRARPVPAGPAERRGDEPALELLHRRSGVREADSVRSRTPRLGCEARRERKILYSPAVSELAAALSQRPEIRAFADRRQRELAARGSVVVEGRDAGTVVFPEAECKFFLDASPDARARRRFSEQRAGGGSADLEGIRSAIAARDAADRTRSVAPLAQSADATYVDSSDLTVDEVVEVMAKEVERACSTRC